MNKEFNIIMNKKQIEAINTKDGNLLIIASAGTGKTTTIVERYVNLVKNFKYGPEEIMMTTFTNKSAKDMIDKISRKIPTIPKHIGTMHSLFLKFLRDNYKETGIKQGFTLLTEDNDKKKNNKELRNSYSNKFKAIMVDEAQDLNAVQRNILELIQNDNLCLIGDDCQNIYSWRGASNELIFKFDKKHKKIILEDNYR